MSRVRFSPILIALCLLVLSLVTVVHAQTAGLSGAVIDSTGASIPQASALITNIDTGVKYATVANGEGFYNAPSLRPGHYSITVTATGFAATTRSGIVLSLDTGTQLDITLKPGNETSVTVSADTELLQPNGPEQESHVTSQQFDDLPLVQQDRMRNPASFVYLTPGVQGNIAVNGSEYVGATNVIISHGSQMYSTELLLEGLPGGQSRVPGNYTESAPSVDSIREFKMTTTMLTAEYGHTGASLGSFAVKSGTNAWHGSAYEYFRNSALDATNWLAKHTTGAVPTLSKKQNEFGGTLGGPIRIPHLYDGRDKTFFFFGYGGSRLVGGAATFTLVQIATADQLQGNFGSSAIYDPSRTTVLNGRYVRPQFPGNKIDPSTFDPVAQKVLPYIPKPNLAGAQNLGGYTGAITLVPDTYTAKIDHNINQRNALSAVYVRTRIPRTTIASPLGKPLSADTYQVVASHTLRLIYDWTISPKLLNSAFAGFNRFTNANLPLYQDQNYTQAIGLKGVPDLTYFPGMTFSSGFAAFDNSVANANVPENDFYYKDRITWSINRHTLKFGGEYRMTQFNDRNPFRFYATFGFSNIPTATQAATGSSTNYSGGNGFASFLLGQAFSGTITGPAQVYTRKRYTAFFVQDDFRATDRLTLNLGLRFEWQAVPREARNAHSAIDLNAPNSAAGNRAGVLAFASTSRPNFFGDDYSAISPRIGLAYRATDSTVVRAGYGLFYSEAFPNTALNRSGYQVTGTFNSPNGAEAAFKLGNGVPQTYPTQPTLDPTSLNGQAGSYYDANANAMPRLQEWTLSIQQQIGGNKVIEAVYVGNHGTRLVDQQMGNINQLDPKYASLGTLLSQQANSAAAKNAGITLPYPTFTGTVAQALRPYPQYMGLTSIAAKKGANIYHAGQIIYRQRTGFGLTFYGGYTWSKNMGYNSPSFDGSGATDNTLQNAYDPTAEWSLLPQDITHALIMNYTYALPFGHGKRWMTHGAGNAVLGGWKVSGIQRYQSGTPLMLLANNDTSATLFNRITRPNIVPGAPLRIRNGSFNFDTDRMINPAAFVQPDNFTFGNAKPSYGSLRNFGSFTEDLSLVKETQIFEHVRWSFYATANNVFNRHRFYSITTNINSASTFGKPSQVSNPRYIQLGTRFQF